MSKLAPTTRPPLAAWPLYLLSRLYGAGVEWRKDRYLSGDRERVKLPGKVISIGNLEAGGTGKSPVTMLIAEFLRAEGYHPVILTRGYRSGLGKRDSMVLEGPRILIPPEKKGHYFPDEAKMQAVLLGDVPVIVGRDRVRAARRYLDFQSAPTHWILDDGFQHLPLERDLDIVLLDAAAPFGNGHLLPLGRLRERPEALKRADVVLFTRASKTHPTPDVVQHMSALGKPCLAVPFKEDKPQFVYGLKTSIAAVEKVALVTAIAKADRLARRLKDLNLTVTDAVTKRDHSQFRVGELITAARNAEAVVTTAKDYWRDPKVFQELDKPIFILPVKPEISAADLRELLAPVLKG